MRGRRGTSPHLRETGSCPSPANGSYDVPMIRRLGSWLLFTLVTAMPLSCGASFRNFGGHGDADCPSGSRVMEVRSTRYCLVTCPGVLEDRVHYWRLSYLGTFDDAVVFATYRRDENGFVRTEPQSVPEEVCRALPRGCSCETQLCRQIHAPPSTGHLPPKPVARCAATDPQCGPETLAHECLDETGYAPDARRVPFRPVSSNLDPSAPPNEPCSHDGECVSGSCGYGCSSLRTTSAYQEVECLAHLAVEAQLADAYCGCVEGNCQWFKQ